MENSPADSAPFPVRVGSLNSNNPLLTITLLILFRLNQYYDVGNAINAEPHFRNGQWENVEVWQNHWPYNQNNVWLVIYAPNN